MKLDLWLAEHKISPHAFAPMIGAKSRNTVYRYLRNGYIPEPLLMKAIYTVTRGDVQPNDFYNLPRLLGVRGVK